MNLPIGFDIEESHPREWVIRLDKNIWTKVYMPRLILKTQERPGIQRVCELYSATLCMALRRDCINFFVDCCPMFSTYKYKIDTVYSFLSKYIKIEDYG